MLGNKKLERKMRCSFEHVKSDISNLSAHIRYIYGEIERLKVRNIELEGKLQKRAATNRKNIKLVASRAADKVHDVKCAFAKKIKVKNQVSFASKEEALREGFTACSCVM